MRMLMLIVPLLALTACRDYVVTDVTVPPPPSLTAPCARPVGLPERGLTQAEVEILWGRDRSALRACGEQLDGLAAWGSGSAVGRHRTASDGVSERPTSH